MSRNETREYIEHRLKLSGWRDDPQFTEGAFGEIFNSTSGIPRRINLLADRVLLYCCVEELHEVDEAVVKTVAEEARQEFPMQDSGELIERPVPDSDDQASAVDSVQSLHPANTVSNSERRLIALEKKVAMLEKTLRKERKRMQQLITLLAQTDDDPITDSNTTLTDRDKAEL